MPIEIRELIIRARVEPDPDRPPQPVSQSPAPTEPDGMSIDADTLAQILHDMKER